MGAIQEVLVLSLLVSAAYAATVTPMPPGGTQPWNTAVEQRETIGKP